LITEEEKFEEFLKLKELKYTSERKLILKAIFSFHKHFDVEELFERLHKQGNYVSRATIYRTIPLLLQSGLIKIFFIKNIMIIWSVLNVGKP
jgi:Fur family ferric uptake transcriptional regulator